MDKLTKDELIKELVGVREDLVKTCFDRDRYKRQYESEAKARDHDMELNRKRVKELEGEVRNLRDQYYARLDHLIRDYELLNEVVGNDLSLKKEELKVMGAHIRIHFIMYDKLKAIRESIREGVWHGDQRF